MVLFTKINPDDIPGRQKEIVEVEEPTVVSFNPKGLTSIQAKIMQVISTNNGQLTASQVVSKIEPLNEFNSNQKAYDRIHSEIFNLFGRHIRMSGDNRLYVRG